jgi:hypothetical protein
MNELLKDAGNIPIRPDVIRMMMNASNDQQFKATMDYYHKNKVVISKDSNGVQVVTVHHHHQNGQNGSKSCTIL